MARCFEYLREALAALLRNKTRSFLTLLGMVIGVAAVDAVYGLSVGATKALDDQLLSGNDPSLTIYVDPKQANPSEAALAYRDAELTESAAGSAVTRVLPFYSPFIAASFESRLFNVHNGNKRVPAYAFSWYAGDPNMQLLAGRGFTTSEVASGARVSLISQDLSIHLYGSEQSAIGQRLTVAGSRFEVVGVPDPNNGTAGKGYMGGSYYFVLPYTTFHNFAPAAVDALLVWTSSPDLEDTARASVLATLGRAHGAHSKYRVDSTREEVAQDRRVLAIIATSLTAIGAISLLVAGMGIMNIMLVAVAERTREIGIRKAVGARRGEIVVQFLTEAGFLSLLGGSFGLLISAGIIALARGALISTVGDVEIPWATVVIYAFLFSLGVGLTFGVYPAARASRLDPIEALRS
jgi:putative ABC transport system permease protein